MGASPLERRFNEFVEQMRRKAEAARKETVEEISKESAQAATAALAPEAEDLVQELFNSSVAAWYNAWSGNYHRTGSLYSIMRFDQSADGTISWGYFDDSLWHPSIYAARNANGQSLGTPYAYYNIYDMAFERGSHGNKLPGYTPVVTQAPMAMIREGKPNIEAALAQKATTIVQKYFDDNYVSRFFQKFNS